MSPSEGSRGQAATMSIPQTETGQAEPSAKPQLDAASARRRLLLEGPIFSTIIRLAAPNVVGSLAQMSASLIQMYFVGLLGVDALAAITLVFPCLMLMQMVASGGIGAGVASAVARNLGAGRRADAEALILNAVFLAIVFGAAFTAVQLLFGPTLYRLLGGSGATLAATLAYSNWVFGGSIFIWILNLLMSGLIGSGNTIVPQIAAVFGLVVAPLSAALMFGWGPMPRLGIAGGGLAIACYYVVATIALICYLRSRRAPLRLPLDLKLIQWRLLRQILQVGGLAALSAAIPLINFTLVTAAVARFGTAAVAGYGIAVRADYFLLPLHFGICSGVLPMVGTNVGAGQIRRARRIAWTGAFIAAGIGGLAGLFLVLMPQVWLGLFSNDPGVISFGSLYLRIVGILFPVAAFGIVLSAGAQGAGRPFWPFASITTRLITAAGGSWLIVAVIGGNLEELFAMAAIGGVLYCAVITVGHVLGRTIPQASQATASAAKVME
jgi:putative MATE family efflux protein